ncbi:NADH dehydrogenase [ubiquinone] 1 beta subcomplex subunit 10-like [Asterias rubens]|uniref:NADH dehydrogenase [ubiquinone] 1 beta subcomplex subunit 10-like n=1 Tax=Asterias rubens TaxID=7604 RepID=UPI001454FEBD|nr:NADH dehydrogenase [ubiquinone] 1 beta subcomplex subunit 10-like [Asterias rubens]
MGVLDEFIGKAFYYTVDGPVTFIRDFVEKQQNRHPSYYYHRQFRRVAPVEDCNVDDYVCLFEAEMQYKRDRLVEQEIIIILQERLGECSTREGPNAKFACKPLLEEYEIAADNFETKYGDLGAGSSAIRCMMKQKNRLLNERRRSKETAQ